MKIPGPDHPITVAPATKHVVVRYDGEIVADTHRALVLKEATYPAVYYVPRSDADMSHFAPTEHHTTCPYKGEARYFSLVGGGGRAENAVWSYETPFPAVGDIREHLAFYPDKVEIEVGD